MSEYAGEAVDAAVSAHRIAFKWSKWDVVALAVLALAILLVYNKVLLTNLVPASGDYLYYFTPYWDYANEVMRSGRLPLWNPYMYAGAPFQANPQTQLFYPLRWFFLPFGAEKGILSFAALHAWLAGAFTYALARRAAQLGPLAAFVAAMIFALNGWTTGLLAQPVRWGTVPWLPAALFLWEMLREQPLRRNRRTRRLLVALVLVWTLALLAGHSQTFYNQAVIFSFWVLFSLVWDLWQIAKNNGRLSLRQIWQHVWPIAAILVLMFGLTLTLSAAQTVPTLELSTQSYRSGGLSFLDHAALSLPPWRLGYTLLPHYARDLGQALDSDAFAEWVAYVGVLGLLLALIGLAKGPKRIRALALALGILGIGLALGAYNPISYLLHVMVPGWNLFRVPARWLQAAVLGFALLAGLGTQNLWSGWRPKLGLPHRRWVWFGLTGLMLLALAVVLLSRPNGFSLLAWSTALLVFAVVLQTKGVTRRWGTIALLGLLALELYGASWVLPIQHPTTPQAVRSWRSAPARIAAEADPNCRTLSLSTTTWDPGDLSDLRQIYGPYLDEPGLSNLIDATKAKEVLAPNLSLLFRLPSLDGFGGGVLPTARFVQSMQLFLPPDRIVADGRLREQMREIPDGRLLSLFSVCYVIADKNFDAWQDNVYYDLSFGETLTAQTPELTFFDLPGFPITAVGLVTHLSDSVQLADGEVVAELAAIYADGREVLLPIRAGIETAVGADDAALIAHNRELPAVRWRNDEPGQDVVAQLTLPESGLLASLNLRLLHADARLFVRGLSVIDAVSGAHDTLVISRHPWQRIHSGDVKIYRNNAVLPPVFLVSETGISSEDATTLAHMQSSSFDPSATVLLAEGEPIQGGSGSAALISRSPEHIQIAVQATTPATLVWAESWYPGWQATLDGEAVTIQRADLLLQAVQVPAGDHTLELTFQPQTLLWGLFLSAITLLILLLLLWYL